MSQIKVPLFGGLITNADPEDLDKQFTPHTHNFDTSQAGTLKRREIATRVKILEDRGFSSMFLFRNKNLANASGAEWLIYCNQRGIIYRMDRFYNDLLLDSYVENVLQYNPSSVPPGQDFLFLLPTEDSTIPQDITFQPFGEYILVGMGHDYPAKVIQAIDNRKMFLGKYTKSTGVYIEDFYGVYPTTYTLTASAQTTMGTLVEGDYYYNYVPVYDGVNEIPIDDNKTVSVSVTPSTGGVAKVDTTLVLDYDDLPCRITGFKVYRAFQPQGASTQLSYRQIKNINFLTPSGSTGTIVSGANFFAGRHIAYSPNGFPTVAKIAEAFNSLSGVSGVTETTLTNTTGTSADPFYFYEFFVAGDENDTYNSGNSTYSEVTDTLTGASYYIGGALYNLDLNNATNPPESFHNMNQYNQRSHSLQFNGVSNSNGFYFSMPVLETSMSASNEDGFINEGGADNWWSIFDGKDLVLVVTDLSDIDNRIYLGIENCYMGKDKIYSCDNVFRILNSHAGEACSITYENNLGNTVTINETIRMHDKRMVAFNLDSNGDPSTDIANLNQDDNVVNNNTTQGQKVNHNDVDNFVVTGTGVGMEYNSTNKQITVTFADLGEADGSVPTTPIGTKYNLRWLHSENHGARMFVANVVLDPEEVNEKHPDMICFSELGRPAIIPISNFIRIRDPEGGVIQGLKSMGDSLVVLMEYGIYRLRVPSIDPASYSIIESNEHIGCVAPKAIVKVEDKVYFCGRNNIYTINSAFQIEPIASQILDKWVAETEKEKTIAEYDPIKEVMIFRFGRVKADAYEYNIRTGEWNKIQVQGDISSMAIGHDGYVYFGDNVHLDITRADGNDNDEDEPELPDDPEITPDPDVYADTYDNTWDDTATIVTEQNINTAFFSDFIWKNFTSTEGSNELTGSNVSGSGIAIGQTISGFGLPSGTVVQDVDGNTIEVSNDATQTSQNPPGFASYTFSGHNNSDSFLGSKNILTQLI